MKRLSVFLAKIMVCAVCAGFFAPDSARAAQSCDTLFEVIVTLKPPTFGFPTVWDAAYGKTDGMVQFSAGLPLEGGTVLAAGRKLSKEDFQPQEIMLAEINRRGRTLMEKSYKAKDGEEPVKIIPLGKNFLMMSNMRGGAGRSEKWVRLSWYDREGNYKKDDILKDASFDYEGYALIPAVEASGYTIAVHAVNRGNEKDQHGLLMRFGEGGQLLWKRAYRPGIPNQIGGLLPARDNSYIASGRILTEDGRVAGWILKLGYDGTVIWQRTYPRGNYSLLRHGAVLREAKAEKGFEFVLTGDARPLDGGPVAAWVLAVSDTGEPLWQRYYRRPDMTASGLWIKTAEDGRTALTVNMKAAENSLQPDHVRMILLSPRGEMLGDESYIEGFRTTAADAFSGWNGERIGIARIERKVMPPEPIPPEKIFGPKKPEDLSKPAAELKEPEPEIVHEGWVFVGTAPDPYVDPCAGKPAL